jgi:hypothetical protein
LNKLGQFFHLILENWNKIKIAFKEKEELDKLLREITVKSCQAKRLPNKPISSSSFSEQSLQILKSFKIWF